MNDNYLHRMEFLSGFCTYIMKDNLFLTYLFVLIKPLLNLTVLSNDTVVCTGPGATENTRVTEDRAVNLPGLSVYLHSKYNIAYRSIIQINVHYRLVRFYNSLINFFFQCRNSA